MMTMGAIASPAARGAADALIGLINLLSDPQSLKTSLKEIYEAIDHNETVKADAEAAVQSAVDAETKATAAKALADTAATENETSRTWIAAEKIRLDARAADLDTREREFERQSGMGQDALDRARTALSKDQQAFIYQRRETIEGLQAIADAMEKREGDLAGRESDHAIKENDLTERLAKLKALAG